MFTIKAGVPGAEVTMRVADLHSWGHFVAQLLHKFPSVSVTADAPADEPVPLVRPDPPVGPTSQPYKGATHFCLSTSRWLTLTRETNDALEFVDCLDGRTFHCDPMDLYHWKTIIPVRRPT